MIKVALKEFYLALTSMKMAIYLLLLLIIVSIPGSILPQKNTDFSKLLLFYQEHKTLYYLFNYLGFFDNYHSFLFLSTLFLLYFSILGCIIPRTIKTFFSKNQKYILSMCDITNTSFYLHENNLNLSEVFIFGNGKKKCIISKTNLNYTSKSRWKLQNFFNLTFHWSLISFITFFLLNNLTSYSGNFSIGEGDTFQNLAVYYDSLKEGAWSKNLKESLSLKLIKVTKYKVHSNKNNLTVAYKSQFILNNHKKEELLLNQPIKYKGVSILPENYFIKLHAIIKSNIDNTVYYDKYVNCSEFLSNDLPDSPYLCLIKAKNQSLLINLGDNKGFYSLFVYDKLLNNIEDEYKEKPIFFIKDIKEKEYVNYGNISLSIDDKRYWGTFHLKYDNYIWVVGFSLAIMIISLCFIFLYKPKLTSINIYKVKSTKELYRLDLKSDVQTIVKILYYYLYKN